MESNREALTTGSLEYHRKIRIRYIHHKTLFRYKIGYYVAQFIIYQIYRIARKIEFFRHIPFNSVKIAVLRFMIPVELIYADPLAEFCAAMDLRMR